MKGIILAGGKGTRLFPLTKAVNKHLLPVGPEPMIYNPVRNMAACGIRDVLIVTSSSHIGDIVNLLGSGKEFGVRFVYTVQDDARGIADALALGRSFAGSDNVFVLLGDNYFDTPPAYFLSHYRRRQRGVGARVMLVEVASPSEFGIAALDETKVVEIQEKPHTPKSNYAVVGAYLYDRHLWDILDRIRPSKRGEYEITSVNNAYIRRGELEYDFVKGMWMDTGTFESYFVANQFAYAHRASRSRRRA
jgi:glucose-1-phosphate thymidylyltransferase